MDVLYALQLFREDLVPSALSLKILAKVHQTWGILRHHWLRAKSFERLLELSLQPAHSLL